LLPPAVNNSLCIKNVLLVKIKMPVRARCRLISHFYTKTDAGIAAKHAITCSCVFAKYELQG